MQRNSLPRERRLSQDEVRTTETSKQKLRFTSRQWFMATAVICLFLAIPVSIHLFLTMSGWFIVGSVVLAIPILLQFVVYLALRQLAPKCESEMPNLRHSR